MLLRNDNVITERRETTSRIANVEDQDRKTLTRQRRMTKTHGILNISMKVRRYRNLTLLFLRLISNTEYILTTFVCRPIFNALHHFFTPFNKK